MSKSQLEFTHNNEVASIILNDGKGNILDNEMMNEFHGYFADFKKEKNLKLISFESRGKHFSFGASVEEHTKENCGAMLESFHSLFYELIDLSIPTMAKISGQCLGGGMELALFCNFLFADKTANMGQPEIMLGVFAPPASLILPMRVPAVHCEEILLTGKSIDAVKAEKIGLLNQVFDSKEEMDVFLDDWISKNICTKSASSLRYAVSAMRMEFNERILKGLPMLEKMYISELMDSNDANEGINSFIEKRKPIWKNE